MCIVILKYFGSRHLTRLWYSHICWIWTKIKKFMRKKMICSKTFYCSTFPALKLKSFASFSSKFVTRIDLLLLHILLETLISHTRDFFPWFEQENFALLEAMLGIQPDKLMRLLSAALKLQLSHFYWLQVDRLLMYYMITRFESVQENETGFEVKRLWSIGKCSNCMLGLCDLLDWYFMWLVARNC